jgi:hypothetical protein
MLQEDGGGGGIATALLFDEGAGEDVALASSLLEGGEGARFDTGADFVSAAAAAAVSVTLADLLVVLFAPSLSLFRISGAPSRRACDVFSCARLSPTSNHRSTFASFCKKRPGGF